MSEKRVVMTKRKQEIKVDLHTPSKMDVEKQKKAEEFWIEKMAALIEKFNHNEFERKYLIERLNPVYKESLLSRMKRR